MNPDGRAAMNGALAGAAATLAMSGVMLAAESVGLMGEHPPEIMAKKGMRAVGIAPKEPATDVVATAAHLAFGAAAGAVFGVMRERVDLPASPTLQGIGYGLFVYTVSYTGWIPAIHIMPPPQRDRPGRQPSMVAAHVVYGTVLGKLLARDAKPTRWSVV